MSSGSRPSRSSNKGTMWEVVEIVAENGKLYQVQWAGKDPKTGKHWPLDWIPSSHCSPELVKEWERRKAKQQVRMDSASVSASPSASVTRKRLSGKRHTTSTPEPPVRSTRKRRHRTPSGSPDNTDGDIVPPRKKKLAMTVEVEDATGSNQGGRSPAHASSRRSRKDHPITEASLPHPPLEEIEVWVPTPNAKFGPPKRKRATGEHQETPFNGSGHVVPPAVASTQASEPIPSSSTLPILTESQIVALREEEEEDSQVQLPDLQFPSTPPGVASPSTPGDLPSPTASARVATEVLRGNAHGSPERLTRQVTGEVQSTNPSAGQARVLEPNDQSIHVQPNPTDTSIRDEGTTRIHKEFSPLPTATHLSLIYPNSSSSAPSSSKSPQKPSQSDPLPTETPGTTSIEKSPSRNKLWRSGNGTLVERRTFEARVRLDELRRAGANFGSIAKGHTSAPKTSQSHGRAPPHVILKQAMDGVDSPSQSQIAAVRNSGNEIPMSASQNEGHRADPPNKSEEAMIVRNKVDNDVNVGSLHHHGDAVVVKAQVVRSDETSEDEVPPTASSSDQSQSYHPSPQSSLGSQLAAALSLLHKKSEEISELRAQLNTLRKMTIDGDANDVHTQADKSQSSSDYRAAEIQTEADTSLDSERARWTQEKAALQDEVDVLRGDKARALADVNFFREQYQRASDFASSTRSENEELSARAALAESQAVNGVALVRATLEVRVTKLEAEVRKYKALSEMLTERARRTDDDVRYRAALMPEVERDLRQLSRQYREAEAELEETQDELRAQKRANVRLRRQVASLETKERSDVAESRKREPVPWSDDDDDEDYRPGSDPSASPKGNDGSSPQHQGNHHDSPPNDDGAQPASADLDLEQSTSAGLEASVQSSSDDMVYLCRWRPGDPAGYCDAVVTSKQELHEHVASHHLSCH